MGMGLRFNGKAIGVEPKFPTVVYTNRDAVGEWESVTFANRAGGKVAALFTAANRQLCITPDGKLETRPAGAIGSWEEFDLSADRKSISRAGVTLAVDGDLGTPAVPVHLEVRGKDFVDKDGNPACYSGVDQFQAFRMFRDKRFAELEALVAESHEFGFVWWRVLMMGSKAQNTLFDLSPSEPGFYDDVRPFADWLNVRGIGLLAEVYADNQDVKADCPGHWQRMASLLRGSVTILSGGNEWQKNHFDPQALTDPGMVWSRGSGTADAITPQNGAPCASFHQRVDWPATMMDAVASEVFMEDHGYTICMMDEPTRFDDGSNKSGVPDSVRFAFVLARIYGALWDLVVFHNYCGQRAMLLTPNLRVVAAAWQKGLSRG